MAYINRYTLPTFSLGVAEPHSHRSLEYLAIEAPIPSYSFQLVTFKSTFSHDVCVLGIKMFGVFACVGVNKMVCAMAFYTPANSHTYRPTRPPLSPPPPPSCTRYLCELCAPRPVNPERARRIQLEKLPDLRTRRGSGSSSESESEGGTDDFSKNEFDEGACARVFGRLFSTLTTHISAVCSLVPIAARIDTDHVYLGGVLACSHRCTRIVSSFSLLS
jgi:hypothetical protein